MISDSCMEQIIKEKKRFEQTKLYKEIEKNQKRNPDIVSVKRDLLTDEQELKDELKRHQAQSSLINLKEEMKQSEFYDSSDMLIDPLEYCPQKRVSENTLEKLVQIIKNIDAKYPKKRYYEIFSLRYLKRFNQLQTAQEMKISQVELSKRFVELVRLAGEAL